MEARVSIIMGSTSDLPVMEAAAIFLNEMQIPFEINALSAHRTPENVEEFAKNAHVASMADYERLYAEADADPDTYWGG